MSVPAELCYAQTATKTTPPWTEYVKFIKPIKGLRRKKMMSEDSKLQKIKTVESCTPRHTLIMSKRINKTSQTSN